MWDGEKIASLIAFRYPQFVGAWQQIEEPVKQADLGRCLILHQLGGLYLDTDIEPRRPLDDWLEEEVIHHRNTREVKRLENWNHDPEFINWNTYDFILSADNFSVRDSEESTLTNCQILSRAGCDFWLNYATRGMLRREQRVLESFGTWALADELKKEQQSKFLVLPSYYFNWNPDEMKSDPPDWNVALHHNKMRWADSSERQPWLV